MSLTSRSGSTRSAHRGQASAHPGLGRACDAFAREAGALGVAGALLVAPLTGLAAAVAPGFTAIVFAGGVLALAVRFQVFLVDNRRRLLAAAAALFVCLGGAVVQGGNRVHAWTLPVPLFEPAGHVSPAPAHKPASDPPPMRNPAEHEPDPAPAAPAGPAGAPLPPPPAVDVRATYEELCGPGRPGEPAPERYVEKLTRALLGGDGRDGVGANVAGCPRPAQPLPGPQPGWYFIGACGGTPRSLGLAVPGRPGVVLLQEAADFAGRLAAAGTLLAATPRAPIGDGDFHILTTTAGDYVLIRSQSAGGMAGGRAADGVCDALTSRNVGYERVPPGLVDLWRMVMYRGWAWPHAVGTAFGLAGATRWEFRSGAGATSVATATCASDVDCTMQWNGRLLRSRGPAHMSAGELEGRAPSMGEGQR